jgi:hypothetical protein
MADKRRRFFARMKEKADRLARIETAPAPLPPLEGEMDDLDEPITDVDPEADDVPDDLIESKPGRRIEPKPVKATGERPWWATAPRDGMTAAAHVERERMEKSKEAKKVAGRVNEG